MSVKPILFNTEMVRAILAGRKNVTRRVIKPQPMYEDAFWKLGCAEWSDNINSFHPVPCHSLYNRMPYKPEDILYVRETWNYYERDVMAGINKGHHEEGYFYKASPEQKDTLPGYVESHWGDKWRPSIHMPKEAARIWLKVTDVRVERLQDITISGIQKEGLLNGGYISQYATLTEDFFSEFKTLWDSTIKKSDLEQYGWKANPYVFVIEFTKIDKLEEIKNA